MKFKLCMVFLLLLLPISLLSTDDSLILSTKDVDGVINIMSFFSNSKGEIFLFSFSEGKVFKFKAKKVDLPVPLMDKIWKLCFLKDGSFYLMTSERAGWKPIGKLFTTRSKIEIKYYNQNGDFVSDIFTITVDGELSKEPGWGGPLTIYTGEVRRNMI